VKTVPCPQCSAQASYGPENPWRPFCSERCRMIDLGAWASESYRIPEPPGKAQEPEEPGAEKP
jgi:endogenous inhibitor of DNA gyrase (YacG/DUF329 family)